MLEGRCSYDDIGAGAQVLVRAEWQRRIDERLADPALIVDILADHLWWVAADADGNVVTRYRPY